MYHSWYVDENGNKIEGSGDYLIEAQVNCMMKMEMIRKSGRVALGLSKLSAKKCEKTMERVSQDRNKE